MRVALVLGAGGARGYAHIGAIEVLRERGYEIVAIAGTSMGALVGGIAACGELEAFTDWVTSLKQRDVLRMLDFDVGARGLVAGNRILGKLLELTGESNIEDLPIPYTAVATDIDARREVWFQKGSLHSAIRASIAMPGVFTPVTINRRLLVDGGVLNPLPIDPIAGVDADLTIAVSLAGPREFGPPTRVRGTAVTTRRAELISKARAAVTTPIRRDAAAVEPAPPSAPPNAGLVDVFSRSLDTMQALIARYRIATLPPDVLVSIPIDACGTLEFHRAAELIELGRNATTVALEHADGHR